MGSGHVQGWEANKHMRMMRLCAQHKWTLCLKLQVYQFNWKDCNHDSAARSIYFNVKWNSIELDSRYHIICSFGFAVAIYETYMNHLSISIATLFMFTVFVHRARCHQHTPQQVQLMYFIYPGCFSSQHAIHRGERAARGGMWTEICVGSTTSGCWNCRQQHTRHRIVSLRTPW